MIAQPAPIAESIPLLKLSKTVFVDYGGTTDTLDTRHDVTSRAVRKLIIQSFMPRSIQRERSALISKYLSMGYSYRNLSATECQLWKLMDAETEMYHFVRLRIEEVE